MEKVLFRKRLQCIKEKTNTSKFYEILLIESEGYYTVFAKYGRIGKEGGINIKYYGESYQRASLVAAETCIEKLKTYKEIQIEKEINIQLSFIFD